MTTDLFSPKQVEFIVYSNAKINLAHGSVRSGKTVCTLFRFLKAVIQCPGESIAIMGYSLGTIYKNVITLLFSSKELKAFSTICTWSKGNKELIVGNKRVTCIGAGDEGALGQIQGITLDLCYCDEMTLYPENVIDMIKTRLSNDHSQLFASMNPKQPSHKIKQWIDLAEEGDENYYSLHFTLDDNPYVSDGYKMDLKKTLSGLFYKRNYLGMWCLAEGAIFDFFDKDIHVVRKAEEAQEYWVAGIDYGTSNPFACVLVGVKTGKYNQTGPKMWVEREYYWDPSDKAQGRQKTNFELLKDLQKFLEPYAIRGVYIDPSAAGFKEEMRRAHLKPIDANNDVNYGIEMMTTKMYSGDLLIYSRCTNLIREIEGYVWDRKKSEKGEDAPKKHNDHAVDALRYVVATHKIVNDQWGDEGTIGPRRGGF